jgi:hypothetical protein
VKIISFNLSKMIEAWLGMAQARRIRIQQLKILSNAARPIGMAKADQTTGEGA